MFPDTAAVTCVRDRASIQDNAGPGWCVPRRGWGAL